MKLMLFSFCIGMLAAGCRSDCPVGSREDRESLKATTDAIQTAFGKGDLAGILLLHHRGIVKDFGGANVIRGRDALARQLSDWLDANKVVFLENRIESSVFCGDAAVETSMFTIQSTPKNGGLPVITRGRSMVVFTRDKGSPTGWVVLREMTQEAPPEK